MSSQHLYKTPGRRLGTASSGSSVVTLPRLPPSQQEPNVNQGLPVAAPRERGGTAIKAGDIRINGKIMGGVMPIGSTFRIGGSLVTGNIMPELLTAPRAPKAKQLPQSAIPEEADVEDTKDSIEFKDLNFDATAVNVYVPVATSTRVDDNLYVGRT